MYSIRESMCIVHVWSYPMVDSMHDAYVHVDRRLSELSEVHHEHVIVFNCNSHQH